MFSAVLMVKLTKMKSLGLFLLLSLMLFAATSKAADDCPNRRDEVPAERTCKKKCKKDSDCNAKGKKCLCDDLCGRSCYNPKLKCTSKPHALPNGMADFSSSRYGSKVVYSCKEGFKLIGVTERVCQSDLKWSGVSPSCEKVKEEKEEEKTVEEKKNGCKFPPRISAGFANTAQSVFKEGDVVEYECRHGYKAHGLRNSTCLADGSWSAREIICSKINCGDPGNPLHGRATGKDFLFGSWVTYVCDEGYELADTTKARRYCSTSGRWSERVPTCIIKTCSAPTLPRNGGVDFINLDYGSLATYSCNQGYRLNGTTEGRCKDDGSWGEPPTCEVDINCDFDASGRQYCGYINTGDVHWAIEYLQQSRSSYPGYALQFKAQNGPFVAKLKSPAIPSSRPLCLQFYYKLMKNLGSNNDVQIKMNGRIVAGIGHRDINLPKKRWVGYQVSLIPEYDEDTITFEIIGKGGADVLIDDLQINKRECVSNCERGYCENNGICVDEITATYCSCSKYYEGDRCETEILCEKPKRLFFGTITANNKIRFGDKVRYSCNQGYKLQGSSVATCTKKGLSNIPPKCEEVIQETAGDCPQNFAELGSMCYGFYRAWKNYEGAKAFCKKIGGRLAIIQSDVVDDFIRDKSPRRVLQWIGITMDSNRKETWANGEKVEDVEYVHFSYKGSEPNTCGRVYYYRDVWGWNPDKWYIEFGKCETKSRFICEKWKKSASSYKVNVPTQPGISGIYKPVAGMLTKQRRQVYRMTSQGQKTYMYYAKHGVHEATKYGWFIGDYKTYNAQPSDWVVYADDHEIDPDDVSGWTKGRFNRLEVYVEKSDFWGEWTDWECSVTCGIGQQVRTRSCDDEANDLISCRGDSTEIGQCNLEDCPPELNPCSPDPCSVNGNCKPHKNNTEYICFCKPAYTGKNCETRTADESGPCKPDSCNGNGFCEQRNQKIFACDCYEGYEGFRCETKKDVEVTTDSPGATKGPVTDAKVVPSPSPSEPPNESCPDWFCNGGGKCQVESGKKVCHCLLGNLGEFCDIKNGCTTDTISGNNIKIYKGRVKLRDTIAIGEGESLFLGCEDTRDSVIGTVTIQCVGANKWSRSPKILCAESNTVCKLDKVANTLEAFHANGDEITTLPANIPSGSSVKFVCKPPEEGQSFVKCRDGTWQSAIPNRCVSRTTCPDIEPITNGHMSVTPENAMAPYEPGVVVTFICDDFFNPTAAPLVRCQENGEWSREPSQCKDVGCFVFMFDLNFGVYVHDHRDSFDDFTVDAGERKVLKCEKSDKQKVIECKGKLKWDEPYEDFTCD